MVCDAKDGAQTEKGAKAPEDPAVCLSQGTQQLFRPLRPLEKAPSGPQESTSNGNENQHHSGREDAARRDLREQALGKAGIKAGQDVIQGDQLLIPKLPASPQEGENSSLGLSRAGATGIDRA